MFHHTRTTLCIFGLASLALLAGSVGATFGQSEASSFDLMEASIPELQQAMEAGLVTSADLVRWYLARIDAFDDRGPQLNSMVYVNKKAIERAEALDKERKEKGPRGPLHGIPIVLKDNYDTADMPTTGGSIALSELFPPDDAFQVRKLREAGAIVIGKTNLHELAAGITTVSSFGGQTRNPYDPDRNPGGSSGGTGAAVAANFAVAGMGSDTCGSIRIPASHNNLVGLRGTAGLSSRDGIIPLSHTQDIGGPLARTVTDLAILLDATVGFDPEDPVTTAGKDHIPKSYTDYLDPEGLRDTRIGILREAFGDSEVAEVIDTAIERMKSLGAETADVAPLDLEKRLEDASAITHEFKFDLMDYLRATPGATVRSLGEILERGLYHKALQTRFETRNDPPSRDTQEYRDALDKQKTFRNDLESVMTTMSLDALLYPTIRSKPAPIGEPQRGSNCMVSSASGLPAISVPAGFTADELPVGVELLGLSFAEPTLIRIAFAFEQATHHRRPPSTTPPLFNGMVPRLELLATATGADCVPPVETTKGAQAMFTFDPSTRELDYTIQLTGLNHDDVRRVCLHQGEKGKNGPILHFLWEGGSGTVSGKLLLTEPDRKNLVSGGIYMVVYTSSHATGELRGQIVLREADLGSRQAALEPSSPGFISCGGTRPHRSVHGASTPRHPSKDG